MEHVILLGTLAGGPGRDEPGEPNPERAYGPMTREACWAFRDSHEWLRARMYPLFPVDG